MQDPWLASARAAQHVHGHAITAQAAAPASAAPTPRAPDPMPRDTDIRADAPLTYAALAVVDAATGPWLRGNRMSEPNCLGLCGWLLHSGWSRPDVRKIISALDDVSHDPPARRDAHLACAARAEPCGPSPGLREWCGPAWHAIDATVNVHRAAALRPLSRTSEPLAEADPWRPLAFDGPPPPIDYICRDLGLAPSAGKITVIAGQPGAGKGPIALHLAICIALGLPIFKRVEVQRPTNVLYLDFEGARLSHRRACRIADALGKSPQELEGHLRLLDACAFSDLRDHIIEISEQCKMHACGVVVIDSYTTATLNMGLEPNQPEYAALAAALGRLGVCVICVAHGNKGSAEREPRLGDIAGSGALGALAQTAIMVWHPDPDDENRIAIACGRAPEGRFPKFEIICSGEKNAPLKMIAADTKTVAADDKGDTRRREEAAVYESIIADVADRAERAGVKGIRERSLKFPGVTGNILRGAIREALQRQLITSDGEVLRSPTYSSNAPRKGCPTDTRRGGG